MERVGKIIARILLVCMAILIGYMLYQIITIEPQEQTLPMYQQIKIKRYCQERKIKPEVIEIHPNGRMFFWLNGRKCEIKDQSDRRAQRRNP